MDKHSQEMLSKQALKAVDNLRKNKFEAHFVQDTQEMMSLVQSMIEDNATVTVGGSMTLFETGIIDYLRAAPIQFLDRYQSEDVQKTLRDAFSADVFLTSTNAVTMEGELFNIDGSGNRVAALTFGPKKVLVIAGINKLVKNMEEAEYLMKRYARPMNNERLSTNNPCTVTGECSECHAEKRICSTFVRTARSQVRNRICVIIVNQILGY